MEIPYPNIVGAGRDLPILNDLQFYDNQKIKNLKFT
jgi:hypothetical protein